jgi:hypothetical protein
MITVALKAQGNLSSSREKPLSNCTWPGR